MSDDLPSGQRMWELARQAIEFEATPRHEMYKIVQAISVLASAEQRFFTSCLDYDGLLDYKEAVEDWKSGYDPFQRNDVQALRRSVMHDEFLSPNAWIERQAELRNDATIDPAHIGVIIRREQAQVLARRAQEARYFTSTQQDRGIER